MNEAPDGTYAASGNPPCMDSFRSTARKTDVSSERISLTACFARGYFIRPFCSSGRRRMHFGKSAAHGSPKDGCGAGAAVTLYGPLVEPYPTRQTRRPNESERPAVFTTGRSNAPAMTYSRARRTTIGPGCLTAVFGMGTGVSIRVWSPGISHDCRRLAPAIEKRSSKIDKGDSG